MNAIDGVGLLRSGVAWRALLLGWVAAFAIDASAQVGYVHALSGSATSQRGTAAPVSAKVGDTFDAGTVFATGPEGVGVLRFADGQVLALAPGSRVRIQAFRFDPGNVKSSNLAVGLLAGAMRFVGGVIATENREAVRIAAGESLISILRAGGIDFTVTVDTNGPERGVAAVTRGEIAVRTPYGPIARIESDQAVPWRPDAPLSPPIPIAAAPAFIQAELNGLRSLTLPGNAPVAVDAAARAAVAGAGKAPTEAKLTPGSAGYVHAVSGAVELQAPSGRAATARVGDTFEPGTLFATGDQGRVVLKFEDGQILVLGPSSIARVDQYRFDEGNPMASRIGMGLLAGSMRFIGGVIASENRDAVRLTAGGSTVQILSRGGEIDFTVIVDTRAREIGVAAVTAGQIAVRTPYGQISRIQADQAAPWLSGSAPAAPVPIDQAPAVVAGEISALLATTTPDNNPVPVDVAARAVVAVAAARAAESAAAANPGDSQLRLAAQEAIERATTATKESGVASNELLARVVDALFPPLPATSAGPEAEAPGLKTVPPGPILADLTPPPISPFPPLVSTPGGGGGCRGSPC